MNNLHEKSIEIISNRVVKQIICFKFLNTCSKIYEIMQLVYAQINMFEYWIEWILFRLQQYLFEFVHTLYWG